MSYLCPLCLKPLTDEERLVRVCTQHPSTQGVQLRYIPCDEDLEKSMFCPHGGDCNGHIETGVFLSHVGCEAKNPFWNPSANTVEMDGRDSETPFQLPDGTAQTLSHWQIRTLRSMPDDVEEMWFPLMLLRATYEEYRKSKGKRISALVELAGTAKVGKSVLAMQAMEYEGYVPERTSKLHVDVTGFMFSRLRPGQNPKTSQFLTNLYINRLMRLDQSGIFEIPPTERMPGDVKAAFIAPSKASEEAHEDLDKTHSTTGDDVGILRRIWENFKLIIRGAGESLTGNHAHPFWRTVAFYDAAGEEFVRDSVLPTKIERAADKVAVLVDATEIYGETKDGNSIAVANEKIRDAKSKGLSCCLVVTKLDLIFDSLSAEDKEKAHDIAKDLSAAHGEARELLLKWIDSRHGEIPGLTQFRSRLKDVERVFFIWTINLPSKEKTKTTEQPRSYGLAKFVCWCLNIDWQDINQSKSGA